MGIESKHHINYTEPLLDSSGENVNTAHLQEVVSSVKKKKLEQV